MNILLPILITATLIGLFSRRVTWREGILLLIVIVFVIVRYYLRGS